jgi:RimJ/RimL family protein N-acetyltransferase
MQPSSNPASIPALDTERLRLRGHTLADVEASVAMWADPAVSRFIGGVPATEQQTWARVLGYLGSWCLMGFGYWMLEERATGRFAGEIGFAEFRREIEPATRGYPEAGWVLARALQGRGFAHEALRAVLAWGDEHLRASRTVCIINPEHTRSLKLAERCGYRPCGQALYHGEYLTLLSRERAPAVAELSGRERPIA